MEPSKKRKLILDEHPAVQTDRSKILRGEEGEKIVRETIRNNVLLFLEKLKDDEAKNPSGAQFQSTLLSAVASALDPNSGPQFYTDLSDYGFEDLEVFGNKEASNLITPLLNLVDETQKELDTKTENKAKVEKTLAYLQTLIPVSQAGQQGLAARLEALDSDADSDAGWLYGILWNSCLQWMDARLRQMRSYGTSTNNQEQEPPNFDKRNQLINIRVHGGDLRVDAVICHIHFGDIRHNDGNYDVFFQESFKKMYKLSIDDGLWLAKHGYGVSRGLDWPRVISIIDKFVAMTDRMAGLTKPQKPPTNLNDVINNRFKPFCAHIASLIKKAKEDADWMADQADTQTIANLITGILKGCWTWKLKGGDKDPYWVKMQTLAKNYPWTPAAYLETPRTAVPRIVQKGSAVMKLRPQARVKYS